MSPLSSWVIVAIVLIIAAFVYCAVIIAGRSDEDLEHLDWSVPDWRWSHAHSHDPILGDEWEWCAVCRAARNATFAQLRDVVPGLGPYDTDEFVRRMQEIADAHVTVLIGPYDHEARGDFDART